MMIIIIIISWCGGKGMEKDAAATTGKIWLSTPVFFITSRTLCFAPPPFHFLGCVSDNLSVGGIIRFYLFWRNWTTNVNASSRTSVAFSKNEAVFLVDWFVGKTKIRWTTPYYWRWSVDGSSWRQLFRKWRLGFEMISNCRTLRVRRDA